MTPALSYVPASDHAWLALVGGRRVLVVEASATTAVDDLFAALSADTSPTVLELLTAQSGEPSFALVTFDVSDVTGTAAVHCSTRGDRAVVLQTVAGAQRCDGAGSATLAERSFTDVTAFTIGVLDDATLTLPLHAGVAWSSAIAWQSIATAAAERAEVNSTEVNSTEVGSTEVGCTEVNDSTVVIDRSEVVDSTVVIDRTEVVDSTVVMNNQLKRPRIGEVAPLRPSTAKHASALAPAKREAPAPTEEPEKAEAPAPTEAPDHTVVIDRSPPQPATAAIVDDEHDGATVVVDRSALAAAAMAAADKDPSTPAEPPAPATPSYYLSLSTGERAPLTKPVLVGRAPSVPKDASGPIPRLVAIHGDKDISRTHVRFALEGDSIVVTDLHSRNGSSIALPGRSPQRLRAGEPTTVLVGTLVDLGNGITITLLEE